MTKQCTVSQFGVQSWCLRHFKDNPTVADKVLELGLDRIEICGAHADFNDLAAWKEAVGIYRDKGVRIVSLGVQTFSGAPSERDWFECARIAGADFISAHFRVDSFHTAVPATAALCEEYGVRIAIHNHGGYMFGGSPNVVSHLCELGGDAIGLCLDTGWAMQIGPRNGDALKWVETFRERLYGIHYKDFRFASNGQWEDQIIGAGNLDLPAFVAAVKEAGFQGYSVIEYEGDVTNPMPALEQCVDTLRSCI